MPAFAGISEGLIVVELTTIMSDSDDIFIFNDPSGDIKSNKNIFWA
ncbi:hypothetical protein NIES4074_43840 [Cylindrospermum sp. NIES-4074]|nr:hypothetical protein NIES4074_43840 [Cylindrospermum sp. NIES-4074]